MYKISAIMDNYTNHHLCYARHGLSMFLETPEHKILVDTGACDKLLYNAEQLDISLDSIDYLVLSHGHYDHTGGLKALLEKYHPLNIIAHPDIFTERYHKGDDGLKNISIPFAKELLGSLGANFNLTRKPFHFSDNVFTTGEIINAPHPRANKAMFVKNGEDYSKDLILDDLSIIITRSEQINIICGCSHAGILNIVEHAIELTGIERINYIIGGLHLSKMDEAYSLDTLYELNKFDIKNIAISHCTGIHSFSIIQDNMASDVTYFGVGDTILIL